MSGQRPTDQLFTAHLKAIRQTCRRVAGVEGDGLVAGVYERMRGCEPKWADLPLQRQLGFVYYSARSLWSHEAESRVSERRRERDFHDNYVGSVGGGGVAEYETALACLDPDEAEVAVACLVTDGSPKVFARTRGLSEHEVRLRLWRAKVKLAISLTGDVEPASIPSPQAPVPKWLLAQAEAWRVERGSAPA